MPPDPADMPAPDGRAEQTDNKATAEPAGDVPTTSPEAAQPTEAGPAKPADAPVAETEPAETVAPATTSAAVSEPTETPPALPEILSGKTPSGEGVSPALPPAPPKPAAENPSPNQAKAAVTPPAEPAREPAEVTPTVPSPESDGDTPMAPSEQAAYVPATPAVPQAKPTPAPAPKPAKTLYAKDILADPRVRGALGKLPPEKRIVQICGIEALEQARNSGAAFKPDLLKGFGKNGGLISGPHLSARGGAVRSRGVWREITFECTVNTAFNAITSFRFAIGEDIPRSAWAARGLAAD